MQEARQAAQEAQEAQQAEPLSDEALRCYKEGLVDLLRPGETVLSALRRMGNLQVCLDALTPCMWMLCMRLGLVTALSPLE